MPPLTLSKSKTFSEFLEKKNVAKTANQKNEQKFRGWGAGGGGGIFFYAHSVVSEKKKCHVVHPKLCSATPPQ